MDNRAEYITLLAEWAPKIGVEVIDVDVVIRHCKTICPDDVERGVLSQLYATLLSGEYSGCLAKAVLFSTSIIMGHIIQTVLQNPDRCHDVNAMYDRAILAAFDSGQIEKSCYEEMLHIGSREAVNVAGRFLGYNGSPVLNTAYSSINKASKRLLH